MIYRLSDEVSGRPRGYCAGTRLETRGWRRTASGAGGCQFNFVLDSDIDAVCVSAGGAAGIALEQTQFSRISGAGTAQGTGGRSLVLENGYNFSNTFFALDLEVSPTCLAITFNHNGLNTFVSPFLNCVTAVNATPGVHHGGEDFTVTWTVENHSPGAAKPGGWTDRVYLSDHADPLAEGARSLVLGEVVRFHLKDGLFDGKAGEET